MITRRHFILATAGSAAGCASKGVSPPSYVEIFSHLAITPSGDVMAVVGRKYDYVFKPPQTLVAALHSPLRNQLSAQFRTFELDTPSHITGRWELNYRESDDGGAGKAQALALGFVERERGFHVLKGAIDGTRFKKNSAPSIGGSEATNRPYQVTVRAMNDSARGSLDPSPIRTRMQGGDVLIVVGIVVLLSLATLLTGKSACITCK
ncbi:hypothetical protein [Massilia sp. S19_KUP03_FR1]|uniref:hypothetical protein n=1 Tax=Massilia sp. S19_KUP03_FR1 TaxID=3025503 RepID=UPI002FCDA082